MLPLVRNVRSVADAGKIASRASLNAPVGTAGISRQCFTRSGSSQPNAAHSRRYAAPCACCSRNSASAERSKRSSDAGASTPSAIQASTSRSISPRVTAASSASRSAAASSSGSAITSGGVSAKLRRSGPSPSAIQPARRSRVEQRARVVGVVELDRDEQPAPAQRAHARVAGEALAQPREPARAELVGAPHQRLALQRVEHREPRRAAERVAEVRARAQRLAVRHRPARHHFGLAHAGRQREAAAQRLAERHDVGRDALVLAGEPAAGATQSGVDLVGHQQRARLVRDPAQLGDEAARREARARRAPGSARTGSRPRRPPSPRGAPRPRRPTARSASGPPAARGTAGGSRRARSRRARRARARGTRPRTPRRPACRSPRAPSSSAISTASEPELGEDRVAEPARKHARELFEQAHLALGGEHVAHRVLERAGLRGQRCGELGVRVAEHRRAEAGRQVDEAVAVGVPAGSPPSRARRRAARPDPARSPRRTRLARAARPARATAVRAPPWRCAATPVRSRADASPRRFRGTGARRVLYVGAEARATATADDASEADERRPAPASRVALALRSALYVALVVGLSNLLLIEPIDRDLLGHVRNGVASLAAAVLSLFRDDVRAARRRRVFVGGSAVEIVNGCTGDGRRDLPRLGDARVSRRRGSSRAARGGARVRGRAGDELPARAHPVLAERELAAARSSSCTSTCGPRSSRSCVWRPCSPGSGARPRAMPRRTLLLLLALRGGLRPARSGSRRRSRSTRGSSGRSTRGGERAAPPARDGVARAHARAARRPLGLPVRPALGRAARA